MLAFFGKDRRGVHAEELNSLPDERLFARFESGDAAAFGVLLERYRGPIYGFVRRQTSDEAAAEELTQEVFLRAIARSDQFRGESRFSTWLFQIARNLAFDHLRRMKFRRHDSLDAPLNPDSESEAGSRLERVQSKDEGALSALLREELGRRLEAAIQQLPDDQREVFLLRQIDGLAFSEIAEVVHASENTVKSRMRYALLKLRQELQELQELQEHEERQEPDQAEPKR